MFKRNVLNKILLLKTLSLAGSIAGTTRLQKIVFVTESMGRDGGLTTFNYHFIRWHYGPYASEINKDIDFLKESGFIDINENNKYIIRPEGRDLLNKANAKLRKIGIREEQMKSIIIQHNKMPLDDLLVKIYKDFNILEGYNKGDTILPIITREETGELVING